MSDTQKTEAPTAEWPKSVKNRDELDSALEVGLNSGVSPLSGKEIVERALAKPANG